MSEKAQGFEEYTPSRLEWLIVMLNSMIQYVNTLPGEGVEYVYTLGGDGNTVVMRIRHFNDIPPEYLKTVEDIGKNFAFTLAKTYNWDSWINIQTQLDPIDRPPKK